MSNNNYSSFDSKHSRHILRYFIKESSVKVQHS